MDSLDTRSGFILTLDAIISLTVVSLILSTAGYISQPLPDFEVLESYRIANNLIELCANYIEENAYDQSSCSFTITETCPFSQWLEDINPALEAKLYYETPNSGIYDKRLEELIDIYIKNRDNTTVRDEIVRYTRKLIANLTEIGNNTIVLHYKNFTIDVSLFNSLWSSFSISGNRAIDKGISDNVRDTANYTLNGYSYTDFEYNIKNTTGVKTRHFRLVSGNRWLPDLSFVNTTDFHTISERRIKCDGDCTGDNAYYRLCVRKIIPTCAINYRFAELLNRTGGNITAVKKEMMSDYCKGLICIYPSIVKLCVWRGELER